MDEFNDNTIRRVTRQSVALGAVVGLRTEKLKRATNECLAFDIGVSAISESSGAISSGYQASAETSTDSNVLFKSQTYSGEEKPRPTLAQAGTQTSPRIFMKTPNRKNLARNPATDSSRNVSAGNLNMQAEELPRRMHDVEKLFEDSILRVETVERVPIAKQSEKKHVVRGNGNGDSDDDEDSVMPFTGATIIRLKDVWKSSTSTCSNNGNEGDERRVCSPPPFIEDPRMVEDSVKKPVQEKDSKVQYKTGMCPSVAESIRAVFAAFLWHEGLVHDAMTCASFLKFHPDLRRDKNVVVKREHKTRCKDATQRYSVEVGLSGNSHHPIKPSIMRSLSSKHENSPVEDEVQVPQVPPVALDYIASLWNEITNTCQVLFAKNTTYTTVYKSTNENRENPLGKGHEDGRKYASKLASDFYKKFGAEDLCELCNTRFPFPVTYHMTNAHRGCGKLDVTEGYTIYGKYSTKLIKGGCGEGGKKNSPWYILCDECRERYLLNRKKGNSFIGFSPVSEESVPLQGSTETHLIMKDNALFALELSANYNKFIPVVQTLPRLKTFGCLPTFGIDSDVIPSEVNLFTAEWEREMRVKTDGDSEKEEAVSVVNSFQRSVSMIGRSWKMDEDNGAVDLPDFSSSPMTSNKRYSAYDLENASFSSTSHSSAKLEALLRGMKSSSSSGAKDRPIISFLSEYHNLHNLRCTIKAVIKKALYKNYGLRAMDWLLHTVTSPIALHDIMWWFIHSFSVPLQTEDPQSETEGEWNDEFDLTQICEHPLVDMALAGEARHHIPSSFHSLLQTIADLMLIFPVGSPLQQIAIKCWRFQFTQSDYNFLHKSKLFVNISKILSRSESEEEQECPNTSIYESHPSTVSQTDHYVEVLRDVTSHVSISVSSHSDLLKNLTDDSTETYWESGEEDRRKMKTITITCPPEVDPHIIHLHADNTRDTNHKLSNLLILIGKYADSPRKLKSVNLDSEFCGWITSFIPEPHQRFIRIDCKGDNILRVRQIKVSGEIDGESPRILQMPCSYILQQRQCESETLKVFRLIIFEVFGELIENSQSDSQRSSEQRGSSDLKEHMVGILFSRRRLNNLQKQVCTHIVRTIQQETATLREDWERHTNIFKPGTCCAQYDANDSYCFEMLCMLSALSGSDVGRSHLAQQFDLIRDLLTLLHVGTTRLQRQVILLLRRVLPEVSAEMLAQIMEIESLPTVDFRTLVSDANPRFDTNKLGILDIFLSTIAKNLSMQMTAKNGASGKDMKTIYMYNYVHPDRLSSDKWYFKGTICKELSMEVNALLKDMSMGKISFNWQETSKAAIAENILNLSNLSKVIKDHNQCLQYPMFWIGLASLSVIDEEHVEKLSSANLQNVDESSSPRPTCSNHDDNKTVAIIQCNICGLLCFECDRFLHLSRRTISHERRVCKEEEEAIKVNLYEGCGRVKLFRLLAHVDSNTLKGVLEFRENAKYVNVSKVSGLNNGVCRFCGKVDDKLTQHGTCYDLECRQYVSMTCDKVHPCGHVCGGIRDETVCLPCLQGCSADNLRLKQDADDMCMICFSDALSTAPSIQLECGHVFHYRCCENVLLSRWPGPRITFNFQQCPICKRSMYHDSLKHLLLPIWDLMKDVRKKALMRLEYEGSPSNYDDPAVYAMEKYAYYVCFKCMKAYYGGEARCEAEVDNSVFNPEELICGACSDVSGARVCPKHGTDFLEYKCRYCCSVAVYFCFGTTHFCNACHEDFQKVIYKTAPELPSCPAGPKGTSLKMEECPLHIKHPPTGQEFALGCGVCRTGRNF